jgi:hypothetical protein
MRFLVDESYDVALSTALVAAGNDVMDARKARPGTEAAK